MPTPRSVFVICFLALTITACDKSDDATDSASGTPAVAAASGAHLLDYVPADTPYLILGSEPPPDAVLDKLEVHADAILQSYQKLLRTIVAGKAAEMRDSGDEDGTEHLLNVGGAMMDLMTLEGMRGAGFGRESTMVLYGNGLLPVLRVALTDGDLFETALKRIESEAGESMATAVVANQSYRYVGDEKGRIIVAIVGDDLVISLVPTALPDGDVESILGLSMPDKTIADTEVLADLQARYGFTSYYMVFVDIGRIANTFIEPQSGTNATILELVGHDHATLSDVCKAEIRQVAGIAPRLVAGYTEVSTERFVSNTVLELRPDIAAGLATLTAPVPGLGEAQGGLMTFGMSLDVLAAREFYAARLDAMEEDPYKCEYFMDLQSSVAQGRQLLQQPVPPVVYDFKGFLANVVEIEGLDLASETPPTSMDMRFLLAMDNVEGLLAMGAMFNQDIAGLNLLPDGKPVVLDLPQLTDPFGTAYAAMTESAIAISVGDGMETELTDMLAASPMSPSPFMTMDMDAARYYSFMGEAMTLAGSDAPQSPEVNEAMAEVMSTFANLLTRVRVDVNFTERGIEMPSTVELAD